MARHQISLLVFLSSVGYLALRRRRPTAAAGRQAAPFVDSMAVFSGFPSSRRQTPSPSTRYHSTLPPVSTTSKPHTSPPPPLKTEEKLQARALIDKSPSDYRLDNSHFVKAAHRSLKITVGYCMITIWRKFGGKCIFPPFLYEKH